ncbi:MAG: hypothetical protein MUO94_01330 [Thermoplasmata archaeon]|nr:hypothetical protein [Thermoplasmata archaeon]
MALTADGLKRVVLATFLGAPAIAFMSFDFMFPNLSTPSLDKSVLAVLLISIVTGMPVGYVTRRIDLALLSVLSYTAAGYLIGLLMYSSPYLMYDIEILLPSLYYTAFIRYTVILVFIFAFGGFVGAVFGGLIRESVDREETSLTWRER